MRRALDHFNELRRLVEQYQAGNHYRAVGVEPPEDEPTHWRFLLEITEPPDPQIASRRRYWTRPGIAAEVTGTRRSQPERRRHYSAIVSRSRAHNQQAPLLLCAALETRTSAATRSTSSGSSSQRRWLPVVAEPDRLADTRRIPRAVRGRGVRWSVGRTVAPDDLARASCPRPPT